MKPMSHRWINVGMRCVGLGRGVLSGLAIALTTSSCSDPGNENDLWNTPPLQWETLVSLPDEQGFAGGFSGTLGHNGSSYLVFAGGANFPDGYPWEGGKKHWYDDIYLSDGVTAWTTVGKLPQPSAYGVSVSHKGRVYLIGGDQGGNNASDKVYALLLHEDGIELMRLPPLPQAAFGQSGTIIGDTIYVAGGSDGARTFSNFWSFNTEKPEKGWLELPTWPGPSRMLAIAGAIDDEFYMFGGAELVGADESLQRRYLRDAYVYNAETGWKQLSDMPADRAASPSPAISLESSQQLIVLAGSDGSLDGQNDILRENHPGFPIENYIYDVASNRWELHSVMPRLRGNETPTGRDGVWAPVTTNTVFWNGGVAVPSGEIKPGVRTPKILFSELPE